MIDLHCHVLPAIDDGPATMEASLDLARAAEQAGVTTLVATPHISTRYASGSDVIRGRMAALRNAVRTAQIELDVEPGAEIDADRLAELSDDELCALRLGNGPWLMVGSPLVWDVGNLESALDAVHRRGHWIVLAHPERSPLFLRDPRRLGALVSSGILCSITARSLIGGFGRDVRRFALSLMREGLVHNVSSDAHDAVHRPPILRDAILAAGADAPESLGRVEWLTCEMPRAILDGDVLPKPPAASDAGRRARPFG